MIRGLLACAFAGVVSSLADEAPTARIRFSNEDQLPGKLESLSAEEVVWTSPLQTKSAAFRTNEVLDLSLPGKMPVLQSNHEATLVLARGDSVKGEIASVTEQEIQIDTWFAGRLKFPRVMVREVKISDRPQLLYRGPTSLDGWTQSTEPEPWTYRNGGFQALEPGSIARDLELPDGFSLTFDLSWRNHLHLSLLVYSDDPSTDQPENGYEITFQGRTVRAQRCGGNMAFLQPQATVPDFQQDEKAKVEIRASSRTKNLCLYVNGKIAAVWQDQGMNAETLGRAIHFVSHDNGRLRVSGIELSAWDGVVDETPPAGGFGNRFQNFGAPDVDRSEKGQAKEENLEGRMMLRNGDSVEGEVLAISEGMITLKTSYDELKLPVSRFRNIGLKPASLEEPKRMKGDVRGWMVDGTSMVFRLEEFGQDKIRGFSQNFGTAEFDLKAFNRLEFNIYSPKLEELRRKEEW